MVIYNPAPDQLQRKGEDLDLRKKVKRIRVQAMLPAELAGKVQATAREYNVSISEVVTKIVEKYYS